MREHPHLQGLLLGSAMLAVAGAAAPFAVDAVTHMADASGAVSEPRDELPPDDLAAPAPHSEDR